MARRKKEPASIHRQTIADAASELFIKKGVPTTTVDQIAKAAGYSKATLYVYFENKEEIFFSLVHQHTKQLYQKIADIAAQEAQSQEESLEHYLNICWAVWQLCQDYPVYFEGLIGHINVDITSEKTPQVYKDIYQLGLDINQQLSIIICQGVTLGLLKSDIDINRATIFLWSSLSGIIRMAVNKQEYYHLLGLDNEAFLKEEFLTLLSSYRR
ncbi:TetR/AcrR family transcriptional regulator [Streptococcus dentiloxodontae]